MPTNGVWCVFRDKEYLDKIFYRHEDALTYRSKIALAQQKFYTIAWYKIE